MKGWGLSRASDDRSLLKSAEDHSFDGSKGKAGAPAC